MPSTDSITPDEIGEVLSDAARPHRRNLLIAGVMGLVAVLNPATVSKITIFEVQAGSLIWPVGALIILYELVVYVSYLWSGVQAWNGRQNFTLLLFIVPWLWLGKRPIYEDDGGGGHNMVGVKWGRYWIKKAPFERASLPKTSVYWIPFSKLHETPTTIIDLAPHDYQYLKTVFVRYFIFDVCVPILLVALVVGFAIENYDLIQAEMCKTTPSAHSFPLQQICNT